MGGYGAFKMAFATDKFSYAASLSGALISKPGDLSSLGNQAYWQGILGDLHQFSGSKNDILTLAAQSHNRPRLYAWIGEQDPFKQLNDNAVATLQKLSYEVTYEMAPGKHEWYYWDKQIESVLEWLPINYVQEERMS